MSISIQLLWVLSGLGAVIFAASGRSELRSGLGILTGWVASTAWFARQAGSPQLPEVSWVGAWVALLAAALLFQPKWIVAILPEATGVGCGCLTGILGGLLQTDGLHWVAAAALAAVLPAITLWLKRRNLKFAPAVLQEEGLLLMLLLASVSATGPPLLEGWQSAAALNARPLPVPGAKVAEQVMPVWVMAISGVSMTLGGLWAVWRHR